MDDVHPNFIFRQGATSTADSIDPKPIRVQSTELFSKIEIFLEIRQLYSIKKRKKQFLNALKKTIHMQGVLFSFALD